MSDIPQPRPNVIVIMADDLGFSDLSCYGSEIPTPNIDRLATRGVRMSSFYTTPRCSPTRASLVTGRYSHEVGIGVLTRPIGYSGSLDPEVPTVATLLSEHGYATSLTGEWHLASEITEPSPSWPTYRGFSDFFGILTGGTSYFNPQTFFVGEEPRQFTVDEEFYLTDALTDHAIEFVRDAEASQQPYFLYLAYTAPHWPLQVPEDEIDQHRGRYAIGWDEARAARHQRQAEAGLFEHPVENSPRDDEEPSWDDATAPSWQQRRMEVYAAQVTRMDAGVGALLNHLEHSGTLDNTIILFLSDNGAEATELPVGRRMAAHVMPPETRSGLPTEVGNDPSIEPGSEATFASYGRAWANLSNTPFRFYKKWVHEGGIAAPLIVSWPGGGIPQGGLHHEPQHVIDILPTLLEAVGAEQSSSLAGQSFLDTLRGVETAEPRVLFWEHIGNAAVRRGELKLVREADGPWELYNLAEDRSEQHDLAEQHPEIVSELAGLWREWAASHGVIAWDELQAMFVERGLPAWQAKS